VLEDIDAKDDVVLIPLEVYVLEVHDAVLVGIGPTPTLGLQHIHADDVDRPPDLETLLSGLDVEDLENRVGGENGFDEPLCLRLCVTGPLEGGLP
jgi:hypothetical protein